MKNIILCFFSLLTSSYLLAQKKIIYKDTIVTADTINLHGTVYDYYSKPVKDVVIILKSNSFHPIGSTLNTKTDTDGHFEFKGVNPKDGLTFLDNRYSIAYFPIKGNRNMAIFLPPPEIIKIRPPDTLMIKAARRHPKIQPSFKTVTSNSREAIFDAEGVTKEAVFQGGINKFMTYIRQNLVYPEKAIENNIEGTVEIKFTVQPRYKLTDFTVIRGIGYGCEEEVIELIKKAGQWSPSIIDGHIYSSPISVSVNFKLTDN